MKIAFIGYGQVGGPLADHLQRCGHDVVLAAAADAQSPGGPSRMGRNDKLAVKQPRLR